MVAFLDRPEALLDEVLDELGLDALRGGRRIGPPQTQTRMDHALTIRTGNGRTIGAINGWAEQQSRTIEDVFDVEVNSNGLPAELIPQIVGTRTVRVDRYDLYTSIMEEAFGTRELVMLTSQAQPFRVREIWREPLGRTKVYEYIAYFSDKGRALRSDGNRIINVNATLHYLRKDRII